ncbi:MAG: N-acetylmuramoyl-L-alanine amidase [Lachnospiraceae bacterium]|nr:N-acetylmuramoyl-L-alanine amidase [Lachnospiraceae bacterium]
MSDEAGSASDLPDGDGKENKESFGEADSDIEQGDAENAGINDDDKTQSTDKKKNADNTKNSDKSKDKDSAKSADKSKDKDGAKSADKSKGTDKTKSSEGDNKEASKTEDQNGQEASVAESNSADTAPMPEPVVIPAGSRVVCIDPGHQSKQNKDTEPLGPGSSEMKKKVSSGTTGRFTGVTEYELNLAVSLKLRDILTARGYTVIMTRETNDVNISNAERAQIANENSAACFVRIHANGSENENKSGAMTICMTKNNPFNASLYDDSYKLSSCILDSVVAATGCVKEKVWATDTMSGINWSLVPVTIVEMGYMTNKAEDELMATDDYREKLATGIADGIDSYFAGR